MPRPIILGVVGDSAAGKTTITRGLVRLLGDEHVTHIAADDYHRYDRRQRAERGITPLNPDCNYIDIMEQDLAHVRGGRAILKPVYQHRDGTFGPSVYVEPRQFTVVEGLLGYHTQTLRDSFDVRVFLAPPEDLRRQWKLANLIKEQRAAAGFDEFAGVAFGGAGERALLMAEQNGFDEIVRDRTAIHCHERFASAIR